ncbi:MAG: PAS domain S-box protein, partial [Thermodesulfovibrionales bacterium]
MLIQEEYFKNIFNTVREGILVLDENMRVLSANRSFFTIFKVDSANTIGSLLYDLGNGQWNIPYLRVLLEDILPKNDTVDDYEIEHNFESIGRKTMLLNACKIIEKKSDLRIILLAIEDITERRKLEEAHRKLAAIVEFADDAIIGEDLEGIIVSWNRGAEIAYGYTAREIVGKSISLLMPPSHPDEYKEVLAKIARGEALEHYETQRRRKDGQNIDVSLSISPVKDTSGKITSASTIARDITERKRLEDLLSDSEERYRRLFETASDGIVLLEKRGGNITHANPAAKKMLGYSEEECIGKGLQDVGISLDMNDFPTIMQALNRSGILNYDDVQVKTKSGQYIYTDIYMVDRARLAQCNIRDVTKHKKLEEQLRQAQKMEAVGLLAGGIAHDFNNILSAIVGYGYILQTNMNSDDPLRENVDQILVAADRAAEVTHSLLAFSRKQTLNPKPINLNGMMKRFEKLLSRLIGEDIEVSSNFTDKDLSIMADAGQIEQVLLNLATNARDAMPRGGHLTLDTQLVELDDTFMRVHGYGKPGMFAVISMSDTGSGMEKETMVKIFEPFFTTKEVGKG